MKELFRQFLKDTSRWGGKLKEESPAVLSIEFNKWLYKPNRKVNLTLVYQVTRKPIIDKWRWYFIRFENKINPQIVDSYNK